MLLAQGLIVIIGAPRATSIFYKAIEMEDGRDKGQTRGFVCFKSKVGNERI
jgi:hypothetical protein